MIKEGSTKILNCMTPGAWILLLGLGYISHIVKIHDVLKNYSSKPTKIDQNKLNIYIVIMNKKGSTNNLNFMTQGARVLVLGCGNKS